MLGNVNIYEDQFIYHSNVIDIFTIFYIIPDLFENVDKDRITDTLY